MNEFCLLADAGQSLLQVSILKDLFLFIFRTIFFTFYSRKFSSTIKCCQGQHHSIDCRSKKSDEPRICISCRLNSQTSFLTLECCSPS